MWWQRLKRAGVGAGLGEETVLALEVPLHEPGAHAFRLCLYPTRPNKAHSDSARPIELPPFSCRVDPAHPGPPHRARHRCQAPPAAPEADPPPSAAAAAPAGLPGCGAERWRCDASVRRRVCAALLDLVERARAWPGGGEKWGEVLGRELETAFAGHGPADLLLQDAATRRAALGLGCDGLEGSAGKEAAAGQARGLAGPAGLDNLGNSCYQNALLQVVLKGRYVW